MSTASPSIAPSTTAADLDGSVADLARGSAAEPPAVRHDLRYEHGGNCGRDQRPADSPEEHREGQPVVGVGSYAHDDASSGSDHERSVKRPDYEHQAPASLTVQPCSHRDDDRTPGTTAAACDIAAVFAGSGVSGRGLGGVGASVTIAGSDLRGGVAGL